MVDLKAVARFIVEGLVKDGSRVEVEEEPGEDGRVKVLVRVSPEDVGRVIGKKGKTIDAIRTVMRAAGAKAGLRVDFDVEEMEG